MYFIIFLISWLIFGFIFVKFIAKDDRDTHQECPYE